MIQGEEDPSVEKAPAQSPTSQQIRRLRILVGGLVGAIIGLVATGGDLLAGLFGFIFGQLICLTDLALLGAVLGAGLGLSLGFYSWLQSEGTGGFIVMGVLWCLFGALVGWAVWCLRWAYRRARGERKKRE
jgi:hypothetical protein